MYADNVTPSMQVAMDETARRREIQNRYNEEHGITPRQIVKPRKSLLDNEQLAETRAAFELQKKPAMVADETLLSYRTASSAAASKPKATESPEMLKAEIDRVKEKMLAAAKALDFMEAANLRDYMLMLTEKYEKLSVKA